MRSGRMGKWRKIGAWMLALALLMGCASCAGGEGAEKHVFTPAEAGAFSPETETLELFVVPLKGADCMLLRCGGKTLLVDTGKKSNLPEVEETLEGLGITKIDAFYNTHPHDDHIGGFRELAEKYGFQEFLTPFPRDFDFFFFQQAVKAADELGIPVRTLASEESFDFGGATITMYQYNKGSDLNQRSGNLLVKFGERTLLLTGDCSGIGGRTLSETYNLHVDILKYPHHGIGYVFREYIENVMPELAIITHTYYDSKSGRKMLDRFHIPYCIATWGVIHAATDGEKWIVDQEMNETGREMRHKYGVTGNFWQ